MGSMREARWRGLSEALAVDAAVAARWWGELDAAYSAPSRHYHTLEHLDELLALVDAHRNAITDHAAVELAIFFHDIVYDAKDGGGGENERRSAAAFQTFQGQGLADWPQERAAKVAKWIELTWLHKATEDDGDDCRLFMDFDMAILAAAAPRYARYAADVRREFGHITSLAWCIGRARFLASAFDAPFFSTPAFKSREADARRNAEAERGRLFVEFGARLGLLALGCAALCATLYAATKS
ncbi:hypothetical protein M885DRAFT_540893, partial [Pelagophyceae sp. CCMP2097]